MTGEGNPKQNQGKRRVSFEGAGRKLDETFDSASRRLEQESQRAIDYLNNEVVPAVRRGSTKALREASEQLNRFAEWLDRERAAANETGAEEEEQKPGSSPENPSPS